MRDYLTVLNRGTELLKYYRVNGFKSLPMTFVTGGTGSRPLAIELAKNTRNVSYVIHTADSGKSTRQIRLFFGNIPAIGDLRSRLIDLADPGSPGHAQITALLYHRLTNDSISDARAELRSIVEGTDDAGFIRDIMASDAPRPFNNIFLTHIRGFCRRVEAMQAPHRMFDYRCASIGNLFLTGAYYAYEQDLETAIALYKLLAGVKEDVIPATLENVHLAALMADGNTIAGQHNITSYKSGPVRELWHASSEDPNAERI
ncbi:MAG: 2-phospho-L-lactate transferase CofD family protein, partial [Candidatus Margulisiibacteriota bacterium]